MVDKLVSVITTAFVITAIGIAVAPKSQTANVVKAFGSAISGIQRASYGPQG